MSVGRGGGSGGESMIGSIPEPAHNWLTGRELDRANVEWENSDLSLFENFSIPADQLFPELDELTQRYALVLRVLSHIESSSGTMDYRFVMLNDSPPNEAGTLPQDDPAAGVRTDDREYQHYVDAGEIGVYDGTSIDTVPHADEKVIEPPLPGTQYLWAFDEDDDLHLRTGGGGSGLAIHKLRLDYVIVDGPLS